MSPAQSAEALRMEDPESAAAAMRAHLPAVTASVETQLPNLLTGGPR